MEWLTRLSSIFLWGGKDAQIDVCVTFSWIESNMVKKSSSWVCDFAITYTGKWRLSQHLKGLFVINYK